MNSILNYISSESWWGMPVDVLAHFTLGALAYVVLAQWARSKKTAIWIVFALAVGKELTLDLQVWLTYGFYFEPVKDIFISVLGPIGLAALPEARPTLAR